MRSSDLGRANVEVAAEEEVIGGGPTVASLSRLLIKGSTSLGAALLIQRALGFVGAIIAARVAGASTFGAYTVGLITASTVAGLLGGVIGTLAVRYAGSTIQGTKERRRLVKRLAIMALSAAAGTAVIMFFGAAPIARTILHNGGLTRVLQVGALYGSALVLLESLKGFVTGVLQIRAVVTLATLSGLGLVVGLPLAADAGASMMMIVQGAVSFLAIAGTLVVVLFFPGTQEQPAKSEEPTKGELARFTVIFSMASVAILLASWGIAALVSRADQATSQVGTYAVASQLNSIVVLVPTAIAQLVLPLLNRFSGRGAEAHVLESSTYLMGGTSLVVALGLFIVTGPAIDFYGADFRGAVYPASLLIAAGVLQMVGASAGIALLRWDVVRFAVAQFLFAVVLLSVAAATVPQHGSTGAGAAWFVASLVQSVIVVAMLARAGMVRLRLLLPFATFTSAAVFLGLTNWLRFSKTALEAPLGWAQVVVSVPVVLLMVRYARRLNYLPARDIPPTESG